MYKNLSLSTVVLQKQHLLSPCNQTTKFVFSLIVATARSTWFYLPKHLCTHSKTKEKIQTSASDETRRGHDHWMKYLTMTNCKTVEICLNLSKALRNFSFVVCFLSDSKNLGHSEDDKHCTQLDQNDQHKTVLHLIFVLNLLISSCGTKTCQYFRRRRLLHIKSKNFAYKLSIRFYQVEQ